MNVFDAVQQIADAVLYEGYVLYPYRASATKNQMRWQFGVVAPRPPHDDGEPWFQQTDCLVEPGGGTPVLSVRVRGLRPEVATPANDDPRRWLTGIPCAVDFGAVRLDVPVARTCALASMGLDARLTLDAAPCGSSIRLRVRLENLEPWRPEFVSDRDAMLCRSLVGAHLLLFVEDGTFVSLLEPPEHMAPAVAECRNLNTWPVLAGDRGRRNLMLSSPIVLYDFPAVANESPGDLFDAAEIDEILSLRIMTMTDEEKQEARATDPRACELLDRVEALTPDGLAALHGSMRTADFFNPRDSSSPAGAFVLVSGLRVERGSRVMLRPNRRSDSMDLFLRDQAATVAGVYRDVDDRVYVAVTVDIDPAATLHEAFGRFFYFDPSEVEPIAAGVAEKERV